MNEQISRESHVATGEPSASAAARAQRREWCVGLAILAAACCFSAWLAYPRSILPPENAGLVVDETELDFGEAWEDPAFPWKFTIRNPTEQEITIEKFDSTCSCVSLQPSRLSVPASAEATVTATLDLSAAFSRGPTAESQVKSPFEAQILPQVQSWPYPPKAWCITGTVAKALSISPRVLDFGETRLHEARTPRRTARIMSHHRRLLEIAAKPANRGYSVVTKRLSDAIWELQVEIAPTLRAGRFEFLLEVEPRDDSGKRLPRSHVHIQGMILHEVQAIPGVVSFGAQRLARSVSETVVLTSHLGTDFKVTQIDSDSKDLVAQLVHAAPGRVEYRITQRITGVDSQSGRLKFHVSLNDRRVHVITVPISYLGISP